MDSINIGDTNTIAFTATAVNGGVDYQMNEESNKGGDIMTKKICEVEGCDTECETMWVSRDASWADWSIIGISKHCSYHWFVE